MNTTIPTDYRALLEIAHAAVFEIASPSARSNITDVIAARAVEQYSEAVGRGDVIRSPEAWVATVARRRAIDAMRVWSREKQRGVRIDVDDRRDDLYLAHLSDQLVRDIDGDGFNRMHTALWLNELIDSVVPDPVNREIALRCIVEGEKPGIVATDLGMEAPAVSNRIARIKARLKTEISIDDLRA